MCNHKEMYCITNCVCEPVLSKLHAKFMTQFPLPLLTFLEYSSQWGYLCYTWDCSLHTKGFTKQGGDGPQVQCQHWLCRCWSHWCENTAGLCALHAAARVWITPSLSARCSHWPWHVQLDQLVLTWTSAFPCWPPAAHSCQHLCDSFWKGPCTELLGWDAYTMPLKRHRRNI